MWIPIIKIRRSDDHFDHVIKWKHFQRHGPFVRGISPVTGEFPTQRPVTRIFDVFFDLRLNKRLSKQSWGWWFETLSLPLWRHCNVVFILTPPHYSCITSIFTHTGIIITNRTDVSSQYKYFWISLIFIRRIPVLVRQHRYTETGPCFPYRDVCHNRRMTAPWQEHRNSIINHMSLFGCYVDINVNRLNSLRPQQCHRGLPRRQIIKVNKKISSNFEKTFVANLIDLLTD